MNALLAELTRAPARPWRWLAAAGLALGTAAALVLGRDDPAAVCADAAAPIGEVWGPAQRLAVLKALSSGPSVQGDAPLVAALLDAYARAWAAQARAACEATHVRRAASEAQLDRRTTCLRGRLQAMRALTVELAAGPQARALEAIDALPPLSHCEDDAYLAATVAPPPPELAGPVAAVRERLAAARAKASVGDLRPALSLTQEAAEAAAALAYPPPLAEAQLQLGRLHRALGEGAEAEVALARAFHLALAHGDDTTATEAALSAANASQLADHREALAAWNALAEDMLVRSGSPEHLQIELVYERGITSCLEHRCDDAPARLETVLAAREARLGPDQPELAGLVVKIAGLWMVRDDNTRAEAAYRRALAMRERQPGSNPSQLGIILGNLAELARRAGRLDEAEAFARRALPLAERSYGVAHPFVARLLHKLVDIAARRGDLAAAEADVRRALSIDLDRSGPSSLTTCHSLVTLAGLRLRAGDLDGAATHAQQALTLAQASGSAEPLAEAYEVIADVALARRRFDVAADLATRGLAAVTGNDPSRLHALHAALGEARLGLGDLAGAREALERALAALEPRAGRANPEDWARVRFALARAVATNDPPRAAALAAQARADYGRAGPAFAARDQEIAVWLAVQRLH
jgi:tetratricopeptide (TPR) repeat protein